MNKLKKNKFYNLADYFEHSLTLARKVKLDEHRANPFLNILNCTLKTEMQFPDLFGKKYLVWRLFHSLKGLFGNLIKSIQYWPKSINEAKPVNKVNLIIISHLLETSDIRNKQDFYFGTLAKELDNEGIEPCTILINHCGVVQQDLKQSQKRKTIILPRYYHPLKEIIIIFRLVFASFLMPYVKSRHNFWLKSCLAQCNSQSIGNYRIGLMISNLIFKLKPHFVLFTFEGHGWEKVMMSLSRKMVNPPLFWGYQHAMLFPGKKAINFKLGKDVDPAHIFTIGKITLKKLKEESEFVNFSILGSVKNSKSKMPHDLSLETKACLFAPEGVIDEVLLMANFALKAAKLMPEQLFIVRLHPVLSRKNVKQKLEKFGKIPHNFQLSDYKLSDDLDRSNWVCYRGSTVVIQAIIRGLRPVFLNFSENIKENDPLPESLKFRQVINREEMLIKLILDDKKCLLRNNQELQECVKFGNEYIMPLDSKVIINKIRSIDK